MLSAAILFAPLTVHAAMVDTPTLLGHEERGTQMKQVMSLPDSPLQKLVLGIPDAPAGSWARAENWAMVAALPDSPPFTAQHLRRLRAARDAEALGHQAAALAAYSAATIRWPDQPLAWQVLANAHYGQGDLGAAQDTLRRALQLAPSAAAHNDLAHVLRRRGCLQQATAEISRAEGMNGADALAEKLARTRTEITSDIAAGNDHCASG